MAQVPAADRDVVIAPGELVRLLALPAKRRPLILNVGPRLLFAQAHIPGAEYIAAGSNPASSELLKQRASTLPRNQSIILYCGCCPWDRCPNIRPAYQQLRAMGFTTVKMLYIANNFGADWVEKGYPSVKDK